MDSGLVHEFVPEGPWGSGLSDWGQGLHGPAAERILAWGPEQASLRGGG